MDWQPMYMLGCLANGAERDRQSSAHVNAFDGITIVVTPDPETPSKR